MSRNISPNIEKFTLNIYNSSGGCSVLMIVNDWIQSALLRDVVELHLQLRISCGGHDCSCKWVGLRLYAYDCFKLQVLEIELDDVPLRVSSYPCFHNLKKFKIKLEWVDNELTSKLFSVLPKLEELYVTMEGTKFVGCTDLNIIAPVLKVLYLMVYEEDGLEEELKVLIDAPMLQYISLTDDSLHTYTLRNLPLNVEADIDVSCALHNREDFGHGIQLIRGLSSARRLSISESTVKVSELILESCDVMDHIFFFLLVYFCFYLLLCLLNL